MKHLVFLLFCITTLSCAQQKQELPGETPFQKELNAEFKDASQSPLKNKDLKTFSRLDFFKYDSTYVVTAQLKRTPDTPFFSMQTTTSRVSQERIYGVVSFELHGKTFALNVYQGQDLMTRDGFKDYLFLPFLDDTNSNTTYGGGRYIDLRIPDGDTIEVDFNKAYNPYCAYNEKYSCPIVPLSNYMEASIEAGVKVFKKH